LGQLILMRLSTSNVSRVNWQLKKGKRVACPAWRGGFTLLEVIVAMSIGLIVIGVAVLSITGVQDENQLRRLATDVEGQVRSALFEAMSSQRPVRLALDGASATIKTVGDGDEAEVDAGAGEGDSGSVTLDPLYLAAANDLASGDLEVKWPIDAHSPALFRGAVCAHLIMPRR
jgi:prepilin-type N-terminal cleavage/methylation domain-containing protein